MELIYKQFLFNKNIFVFDEYSKKENQFEVLYTLAKIFGIKISEGVSKVSFEMLPLAQECLGYYVNEPFYKGFPESARSLSKEELLFDQLLNYFVTYELDDFSNDRHSVFEKDFERLTFKEDFVFKYFKVIDEKEAYELIKEAVINLLNSSRALSESQFEIVKKYVVDFDFDVSFAKGKNTIIKLLMNTRNIKYASALSLSDFIKVVEQVNFYDYGVMNVKKLNLKNKERKFLTSLLDYMLSNCYVNIEECFEKKKKWSGILHHLHYIPKTELGVRFLAYMRSDENHSAYSSFEKAMLDANIKQATDTLIEKKGSSMLLRKLNYIISRCKSDEDIEYVVSKIDSKNVILLIQLILQYDNYQIANRTFTYARFNKLKEYEETIEEAKKRKSKLSAEKRKTLRKYLLKHLESKLKGKLGNVYLDMDMKNIALPINVASTFSGYGILPTGSRIKMEDGKKIRAFTYWEKVDDIDLSVIGIGSNNYFIEFSWRSMYDKQDNCITFSGDKVDGFNGGSEYFDVDLEKFKKKYPKVKYLIFNDNVFSASTYKECNCTAGYMFRDINDSGEVFEPKTVKSSFRVTVDSRYAHLFALDLDKNEFVWLNIAVESYFNIAGESNQNNVKKYLKLAKTFNYYSFFKMLSSKVVKDPKKADIVVTDKKVETKENAEVIRSYDIDKVIKYLNT